MTSPQKDVSLMGLEGAPRELARAEVLRLEGKIDEALRIGGAYLRNRFDDVGGLLLVASIFLDADKLGIAHPLLMRAAQLRPDIPILWNNIGICYREGANWDEAEMMFQRGLKIDPHHAMINMNLASLYVNMGQPNVALKHIKTAIASDPSIPETYYQRARALVSLGDYSGWADLDSVLGRGDTRKERVYGMVPRWNGVESKKLIAYGEQGVGDEIAFSACIPDLAKNNDVIVECDPRLWGLFKRSFGLETHGTRFSPTVPWLIDKKTGASRKIDAGVAMGSLPQYYRKTVADCPGTPYLVADPERRLQWRSLLDSLGPKLKVGITWTGGNPNTGRARRSLELDDLLPILRQDATFVSLQYEDTPEIGRLQMDHGITVHHWKHATQTQDYDDTAALVAELDIVISVQTAVIHLAGALGKECWVMVPKQPRWFYGITGERMPWYGSNKLYRQKGEWAVTIGQVAKDLRERIMPRAV